MREIGLPFSIEVVNVTAKQRADGSDYKAVASRGMVPLLELDNGERLTENLVIVQYLCDRSERHDLMPPAGTMSRYHVMEWQSFIAAELHKSLVPLYWPGVEARTGELVVARIRGRLGFVERNDRVVPDRRHFHRGRHLSVRDRELDALFQDPAR